jgi:hypothetical protein
VRKVFSDILSNAAHANPFHANAPVAPYMIFPSAFLSILADRAFKFWPTRSQLPMFALLFCSSLSLIPVPKRVPGIHFGPDTALIIIEVICDSVCPDCATIWPIVESVLNLYPTQVNVQLHFLALPSHTWAYAVARGVFAAKSLSEDAARNIVHGLYVKHEQNQFTASALKNTPESQVIPQILTYISSTYGISYTQLQQAYATDQTVLNARIDFKYAFIRHVPGTPTVFFNGAQTTLTETSSLADWTKLIDSLI